MEGVVLFIAAGLLFLAVRGAWRLNRQRLLGEGKVVTVGEVLSALGLSQGVSDVYRGKIDGMSVNVAKSMKDEVSGWSIEIQSDAIPSALQLSPETISAALRGVEDITVGDRAFDARALVQGDLLAALAISKEARDRYLAVDYQVYLVSGTVSAFISAEAKELELLIRELLQLTRALACSEAELQERSLEALARARGPRAVAIFADLRVRASVEVMARAVDIALAHPESEVRVAGAMSATIDTTEMLLALVSDRKSTDNARAKALELLAKKQRLPESDALLKLLSNGGPLTMRVVAEFAPDTLADALERNLIIVVHNAHGPQRVAAIESLAKVGTGRALELLKSLSSGMTVPGEVKAAARKTIAAIQQRRANRGGELAIADDDHSGGSLSMTSTGGELSSTTGGGGEGGGSTAQ